MHHQVSFPWLRLPALSSLTTSRQNISLKSFLLGGAAALVLLASAPAMVLAQDAPTAKDHGSDPAAAADIIVDTAKPEAARETVAQPAAEAPVPAEPYYKNAAGKDGSTHESADDATGSILEKAALAPTDSDVRSHIDAPLDETTSTNNKASAAPSEAPRETKSATAPATADHSAVPKLLQAALENLVLGGAKGPHAAEIQKNRESIAAFYTQRDFAPLWTANGQATPAANAVVDRLRRAPEDGLDLVMVPDLLAGSDEDRVKADLALSEAVVAYGQAASGSRVDPKSISALIGEKPDVAEPFAILSAVSTASAAGNALQAFNPPQKDYQALREKLAELHRQNPPVARLSIPSGPELTVGMRDPRVTLIRARFGLDVQQAEGSENLVYDTRVAAAVADFQKTMGLPASGVLTTRTIAALSGGQPSRLENEILANMERWRWMPRDMGETYIAVNIPDFAVSVIHGDQVLTRHRVVVGKPETPTPVFSNKMQYLIVNPYWNVPQSIIHKEFLPKGGGDLSYLSAAGWEVSSHNGQMVVRQPPGEKNALGHIKFLFPNDYSVYLHDTPSRALFASERRAFSHGCVRVDQPFGFAETVLNHSWSEQKLKGLIGDKERYINLPAPLPIHIEYFTTYVDESGRLQLREDLYGYSHKVKVALGLER